MLLIGITEAAAVTDTANGEYITVDEFEKSWSEAAAVFKDIIGQEKCANPLMVDFNGYNQIDSSDASAIQKRIVRLA